MGSFGLRVSLLVGLEFSCSTFWVFMVLDLGFGLNPKP